MMNDFQTLQTPRGKSLQYRLTLPRSFHPTDVYPTILALPPGDQSHEMVMAYNHWLPGLQEAGWAVCSPVAPDGKLFFQGSERYLPHIMTAVQEQVTIEGGKFYLLGVSNGGVSAFRAATLNPDRFHTITVIPGWPKPADEKRLDTILHIPIHFLVGEKDDRWRKKSEHFHHRIAEMNGRTTLEIIPDQGHMAFHTITAVRLLEIIQNKLL